MFYIVLFVKSLLLEYILIFSHELIHMICSFFLRFKISFFHVIPFTIYKKTNGIGINLKPRYESGCTGRLHFDCENLYNDVDYLILLKKLKIFFWVGPIFDFTIFIILFVLGISYNNLFYLTITSIIHFCVASITFFNSDGKYSIGAKEDSRIAFDLVRIFTLCGSGVVNDSTKRVMTDAHIEISRNIHWTCFEIDDLWNFLNNISFYTNSIYSYLNGDLLYLDDKTENFMESLITDFDKIKKFDYRQVSKTSISILMYYIYRKIQYVNFTPNKDMVTKIINGCNSVYYKNLYQYYFNYENIDIDYYKNFLNSEENMPLISNNCPGYNKIFFKLVSLRS